MMPLLQNHTIEERREEKERAVRKAFNNQETSLLSMAKSLPANDQIGEDDYIDMDFSSATTFFCSSPPPPHPLEFEFQMSATQESHPVTSPADELFYKGKLLPLHLPPRLQMVEELLQIPTSTIHDQTEKSVVLATPYESCNVSPAASCYISGELNPEDYFHECSAELLQPHPKKSWTRKLKFIKEATVGLKLKAPKAYFKSFFGRSGCPNEKCAASRAKKNPFRPIQLESYEVSHAMKRKEEKTMGEESSDHRRSFSDANNWQLQSSTKSSVSSSFASSKSSSFSSVNSNEFHGQPVLKRSSSVNSDVESSIQGAIAYCKKSQLGESVRRGASNVGFCLLSVSKIAPENCEHEKPGILLH